MGHCSLRIQLLHEFSVSLGRAIVPPRSWRSGRARALVKVLALAPGHKLHREQVIDMLWPDAEPACALHNLRSALHAARAALEPGHKTGSSTYLPQVRDMLHLESPAGVWVDVDAFREAAAECRRHADVDSYRAALALYAGDLLPEDRYEDWAAAPREALRETCLTLMVELGHIHESRDEFAEGIAVLEGAVVLADSHEDAHAGLMRLHALAGRPGQALRQYARLSETLARELGVAPMPSTVELREQIASGRFGMNAGARKREVAGGVRSSPSVVDLRRRLPVTLDRFIGRRDEIADVAALLGGTRVLTLTGAGGSGKTRLAIEVARQVMQTTTDAVWFVELGLVRDPARVPGVVAAAIGVSERMTPLLDSVAAEIGGRRAVMVLDNCEHLVDACADLISELLGACPGLRVLATSREPLRISGEVHWRVPPLTLPPDLVTGPSATDLDDLARSEAVALLVDRMRAVQPAFELTSDNAVALSRICRQLDGIPLAIELAAARTSTLPPEHLAARLDSALQVLTEGSRSLPDRQRTIRSTLDWSHALLEPTSQVVLRRLAVFAGGWTLEAAEFVCRDGAGTCADDPPVDVLEALTQLVDKSMVQIDEAHAMAGAAAGVRYRMLEIVRQYAVELLERSGERDWVRHRHVRYFTRCAEAAERELNGPDQSRWRTRLDLEQNNVRAGLRWCAESGHVEMEARLCAPMWRYWIDDDHLVEGDRRFSAAVERSHDQSTSRSTRARLMHGAAALAAVRGDLERTDALCESARALFEALDDRNGTAASLHLMGVLAEVRLRNDEARRHYQSALAIREATGDTTGVAATLHNLGNLARLDVDPNAALDLYQRSMALNREVGNDRAIAMTWVNLAALALDLGDHGLAERCVTESVRIQERLTSKGPRAIAFQLLAFIHLAQGRTEQASKAARSCLQVASSVGDQRAIALGLEAVAAVSASSNTQAGAVLAAQLLGAAESTRRRTGMPLPSSDAIRLGRATALGRTTIGSEAFDAGRLVGSALPLEEAIRLGLGFGSAPATIEANATGRPLTRREREIADFLARGMTNASIAAQLGIARRTVDTHVSRLLRKLGVSSRVDVERALLAHTHT